MLFLSQRLTNLWVKGTVPLFNYGQTGEELTTIGSARFITRPGTSDRHIIWEGSFLE